MGRPGRAAFAGRRHPGFADSPSPIGRLRLGDSDRAALTGPLQQRGSDWAAPTGRFRLRGVGTATMGRPWPAPLPASHGKKGAGPLG